MDVFHDDSRVVDILYLDFKKPSNRVAHKGLLTKAKALEVLSRFLECIEFWLSERRQRGRKRR